MQKILRLITIGNLKLDGKKLSFIKYTQNN